MHIVLTHLSPADRRERIYAGWLTFVDDTCIAIINDGEYKAFDVSEMLSVISVMTGEEIAFDDLKACLNLPK
ncbi:hypothetical protein [Rhizobium sp. ZX09]|uniref:hypothetical protein n=1 Tax=Rhizobium sp. ZX09 TaxID=2291939 RepID=UPI001A97D817|nr:hypothetical protein [Rhizobium sp. ZX09]QSZ60831.1 hypothetical protein BTN45_26860 [Rhizobium sp. ZX09]